MSDSLEIDGLDAPVQRGVGCGLGLEGSWMARSARLVPFPSGDERGDSKSRRDLRGVPEVVNRNGEGVVPCAEKNIREN